MHLTIPSTDLTPALRSLKLALTTGRSRSLPILRSILIHVPTAASSVHLTVSDLDHWLTIQIPLDQPATPGTAALEIDPFLAIRPDKNTPVRIDITDHNALAGAEIQYVSNGCPARTTTSTFPTTEFPHPRRAAGDTDHTCLLPTRTVAAIAASIPFQSKEETRYVLNGVFLDPVDGGRVIATDGRRLYVSPTTKVTPNPVIIPSKTCRIITKLGINPLRAAILNPPNPDEIISYISIRGPHWTLQSKLIEGNFPNYRQIIPDDNETSSSITFADGAALAKWLRNLPADHLRNSVTLTPKTPHHVHIHHHLGTITTTAHLFNSPPEITFNPAFLADALDCIPTATLRLSTGEKPAMFVSPSARIILMPMRITKQAEPKVETPAEPETQAA